MKLSRSLDNFIENNVRPLALGRKNYLFCGNHDAAENAAIIYTFMGCCKLAQVDVRKWLNYFFTHIHDYDNDYSRDLLELLPHSLKQKGILWHSSKILGISPRILENPTRFWKYLWHFRKNSQYGVYWRLTSNMNNIFLQVLSQSPLFKDCWTKANKKNAKDTYANNLFSLYLNREYIKPTGNKIQERQLKCIECNV